MEDKCFINMDNNVIQSFIGAIRKRDINEVVRLTESNVEHLTSNDTDFGELISPLYAAIQQNAEDIVQYFVEKKLFLDKRNDKGELPVYLTCYENVSVNIFKMLFLASNLSEEDRKEVCFAVVENLQTNKLDCIIQSEFPICSIIGESRTTLLHHFCFEVLNEHHRDLHKEDTCCIIPQKLIDAGVPVMAMDNGKSTALHLAAEHCEKLVKLLLKHGANAMAKDSQKRTPIHSMMYDDFQYGNAEERIDMLIEYGADINDKDEYGFTPLAIDAQSCFRQCKLLLSRSAKVGWLNELGQTVFHILALSEVARSKHLVTNVQALMNAGEDVNVRDINLQTALHAVFLNDGYPNFVQCITKLGNVVSARDKNGTEPLHLLSQFNNCINTADILLNAGANINAKDVYGSNALHYAAYTDNVEFARFLVERGLSINSKTNSGMTPKDIAELSGSLNIFHFFTQTKMDANITGPERSFQRKEIDEYRLNLNIETHRAEAPESTTSSSMSEISFSSQGDDEERWIFGVPLRDIPEWLEIYNKDHAFSLTQCADNNCSHVSKQIIEENDKLNNSSQRNLLLNDIDIVVNRVTENVEKLDPRFSVKYKLAGSAKEGTMLWEKANDYDLLCILQNITKRFKIEESNATACVRLNRFTNDNTFDEFCDEKGYLSSTIVANHFQKLIWKSFLTQGILDETGLTIVYRIPGQISTINLTWYGPISKFLPVTFDVVPAISTNGWWPKDAVLRNVMPSNSGDCECVIIVKPPWKEKQDFGHFQLSFSPTECSMIKILPRHIKLGYVLAKKIAKGDFIPQLKDTKDSAVYRSSTLITSYMLKTALLHEMEMSERETSSNLKIGTDMNIVQWALQIYKRLLFFLDKGCMPSYFFPGINVLALNTSSGEIEDLGQVQKAFSDIIIAVLDMHKDNWK